MELGSPAGQLQHHVQILSATKTSENNPNIQGGQELSRSPGGQYLVDNQAPGV